jgi:uridylate kinase
VYDSDPAKNAKAKKFDKLSYLEMLNRKLEVMDSTAISLCMENKLPILVLNLWDEAALKRGLLGGKAGTLISME